MPERTDDAQPDDYVLRRDLPHDPDLGPEEEPGPGRAVRPAHLHPSILLAVVAGGVAGTLGRYELALAWAAPAGRFPAAIFFINTTGALLLGVLLTVLVRPPVHHRTL